MSTSIGSPLSQNVGEVIGGLPLFKRPPARHIPTPEPGKNENLILLQAEVAALRRCNELLRVKISHQRKALRQLNRIYGAYLAGVKHGRVEVAASNEENSQ